jgi:hypothetical protein
MDVSDAKRLKVLEDENGKLKRLLADAMLPRRLKTTGRATNNSTYSGKAKMANNRATQGSSLRRSLNSPTKKSCRAV